MFTVVVEKIALAGDSGDSNAGYCRHTGGNVKNYVKNIGLLNILALLDTDSY
jgi:hypothetical protein